MVVLISRQGTGFTGSPFKHVRREGTVVKDDFCQSVCGHEFSIDPAMKCPIHERFFSVIMRFVASLPNVLTEVCYKFCVELPLQPLSRFSTTGGLGNAATTM